ncbi:MAG: hypothetical protein ACRDJU_06265 [Actinomycetota bacterium]
MDELEALKQLRVSVAEPGAAAVDAARATLLATFGESPEPRRSGRRRLLVAGAIATAVIVVGGTVLGFLAWGGSGSEDVRVGGPPPSLAPQPQPVSAPTNFLGPWTYSSVDPIDDFLNAHSTGDQPIQAASDNAVATCMQAHGWSYESTADTRQGYGSGEGPTSPVALEQYRETYGYGYLVPTPDSTLSPSATDVQSGQAADDANGAYEASLSSADRARYVRDLGSLPAGDPASRLHQEFNNAVSSAHHATPSPPGPAAGSGCLGTADAAEQAIYPPVPQAAANELQAAFGTIAKDPAMVAGQAGWSACMAGKGFRFSKESQAESSISAYFGDEMTNGGSPPPGLPGKQALELRTATADAQCSMETVWPVQSRLGFAAVQKVIRQFGASKLCGTSKCLVPEQ